MITVSNHNIITESNNVYVSEKGEREDGAGVKRKEREFVSP